VVVHTIQGSEPVAWITDFGLSVMGRHTAATNATQLGYRPPELQAWMNKHPTPTKYRSEMEADELKKDQEERRERNRLLEKADVYSFGVTAYTVRDCEIASFLVRSR